MYKMQKAHEYLWQITGLQRNFRLGTGSNRLSPELPEDFCLPCSAAKLKALTAPWIKVSDFKHSQTPCNCGRWPQF